MNIFTGRQLAAHETSTTWLGRHGRRCSHTKGGKDINDRHPQDRGQRINEQIRISPVRLIGAQGEQLGILPTSQAMDLAREANLDLVEVAPTERPPVCKIMDFGKFRYQQSRKGTKTKPN